jgi:hypothetical protein
MIPDSPSALPSIFTAKTASAGDSFLSFLNLSSTDLNNNDVEPETTPAARALKNSDAVSTLLANAVPVPAVPAESQPLPFKLSFNIFGAAANAKPATVHQTEDADAAAPESKQSSADPAPVLVVPNPTPIVPQSLNTVSNAKSSHQDLDDNVEAASPDQSNEEAVAPAGNPAPTPKIALTTPALSVIAAATTSVLPAITTHPAAAPVTAVRPKADGSRPSRPNPAPAIPTTVTAPTLTPSLPAPVPSDVAPVPTGNLTEPAPVDVKTPALPAAPEPRAQQSQPSLNVAADVAPQSTPPAQLAFALRVQPDPTPAAMVPVAPVPPAPQLPSFVRARTEDVPRPAAAPAPITAPAAAPVMRPQRDNSPAAITTAAPAPAQVMRTQHDSSPASVTAPAPAPVMRTQPDSSPAAPPEPKAANPSDEATAAAEIRQSPAVEQAPVLPNKPVSPAPAVNAVPAAESQAGQNAAPNSGNGAKGGDTSRDSNRAADPKAEPTLPMTPAAPAPAQSYYTAPASVPSASNSTAPATASTPQTTPAVLTAANETPKTGTANQISITVPAGDQQNVQVRLTDRAGEVRVSVHAPNEELAGTLRQDLGSLTTKLNQSGFSTEAFTPSTGSGTLSRDQKNADPQPQNQDSSGRQTPGRSPQQQNSQQNGPGKRPAWMDEFESSMTN